MDALIRWLDAKVGRRLALGKRIGLTRSGMSQLLKRPYLRTLYIARVHEFSGIPLKYLIRGMGEGLTEQEMAELDTIARKRELEELEAKHAATQAKLRGK